MFRKTCILFLALLLALGPGLPAWADEIVVSGNGEGSTNGVNVNTSQAQTVEQTNTANVDNNVDVDANTGDNSASNNSGGDTSIDTGNIEANVNIENSGNASSVELECCPSDLTAKISGNGSDSQNDINITQDDSTKIAINNTANITNNENGYANTGKNNANDNTGGSVSIITGNIKVSDSIINSGINIYNVDASAGSGGSASISIIGNGSGSNNSIVLTQGGSASVNITNTANINNNSNWVLNTGDNNANGNTGGSVSIVTGDIEYIATIKNGPINVGIVDIDCCPEEDPPVPPDVLPPPPPPPNGPPCPPTCPPGGKGDGVGPAGGVSAAAAGIELPVTGGNFTLYLIFFAHGLMFFLGWYLRMHSGRAPNFIPSPLRRYF